MASSGGLDATRDGGGDGHRPDDDLQVRERTSTRPAPASRRQDPAGVQDRQTGRFDLWAAPANPPLMTPDSSRAAHVIGGRTEKSLEGEGVNRRRACRGQAEVPT